MAVATLTNVGPTSDWVDSIPRLMVPVAVAAAFYFFGQKFPAQTPTAVTREEMATPISGSWTFLSNALTVANGVVLFLAVVNGARLINRIWGASHGPYAFLLTPSNVWWYLYGGFFGLCLGWPLATMILRKMMDRKTWEIWLAQQNQKAGFDCSKAMRWLAYLILVPYTALFLPSLGCHARFSTDEIGIQGYLDWNEARHAYSDVTRVALIDGWLDRSGVFNSDPRILIDFHDGKRWTTRDGFRDPEPVRKDLLDYLISHTGVGLTHVRIEQSLP